MTDKLITLRVYCDEFLDGSWFISFPDGETSHVPSLSRASEEVSRWVRRQPECNRVLVVTWNRMGGPGVQVARDQQTDWFTRVILFLFKRLFR